jgi:hypothetical protein
MAAVATEKVQSTSLNLGFPHVYASVYAARKKPEAYFPSVAMTQPPYMGDSAVQALRLARKADADYMAMAALRAHQSSQNRYTTSPHGMGALPKPVLGQRIFANPSTGAAITYSGRQNHNSAPFHFANALDSLSGYTGGVLRTREGQAYGKKVLTARVGQLNRIDAAAEEVGKMAAKTETGTLPGTQPGDTEQLKIQLNLALQQLTDGADEANDAVDSWIEAIAEGGEAEEEEVEASEKQLKKINVVVGNLAQFGFGQLYTILRLTFVLAPTMSEDDLNALNEKIATITTTFEHIRDAIANNMVEGTTKSSLAIENMLSISAVLERLKSYSTQMVDSVNRSDAERQQISKALIKSLKFGKDLKRADTEFLTGLIDPAQQTQARLAQNAIRAEDPEFVGGRMGRKVRGSGEPSVFSRRANTREDDEQPSVRRGDRSGFGPTPRDEFGYASGEWYKSNGRGDAAFFNQPKKAKNTSGPGYEALKTGVAKSSMGAKISKQFDKITGGYNVAFY